MKLDFLKKYDFFTGVPDSQLKPLCNYLMDEYGISDKHVIAANEGNAVALATGYYLATGKIPVVYLQNSGIGNIINPVASLTNPKVYAIPMVFIVGWRGEPGVKDEPQHIYQGEVTLKLLEDMGIEYFVVGKDTTDEEMENHQEKFQAILEKGKSVAFVIKKDALEYEKSVKYKNENLLLREEAIKHIVKFTGEGIVVSTTGKTSRELFETREANGQPHAYDFLTVGSMGHCSSIALGIALNKPCHKVWCLDGDGAAIMHMGSMGVIASRAPKNLVHIVFNNEAHESVGGMPTVAKSIKLCDVALACGYKRAVIVSDSQELDAALEMAEKSKELFFIEIKTAIGSRSDLGRPTQTPQQNRDDFMEFLSKLD